MGEALIETVKKFPILYDMTHQDYKNVREKEKIWDEIGKDLNEDGSVLKAKWKNLRDCYSKYLRTLRTKTGQAAPKCVKQYNKWPWAKQMEFFKPFLKFAKTASNVSYSDNHDINEFSEASRHDSLDYCCIEILEEDSSEVSPLTTDSSHQLPGPCTPNTTRTTAEESHQRKKRRQQPNTCNTSAVDKVISYLNNSRKNADLHLSRFTGTELLFLGYAKLLDTFSPLRQAQTKMQISNIIMKQDLQQKEEDLNPLHQQFRPIASLTPRLSTDHSFDDSSEEDL